MPADPHESTSHNTRSLMLFLQQHAPFNNMDDSHLALFAENTTLRFFADGDVVLSPDDGVVTEFNIVKQGRICGERENKRDGRTERTFEISQGECFPVAALIGERPTRTLHRAAGDTFCLSLDHDAFVHIFADSEPFRDFCLRGVSSLLDQVNRHAQSKALASIGNNQSLDTPLERYALRNPIVCSPDAPIRKVVSRMHENAVGSMVITDDERRPVGIFTLRDLRTLIAEEQAGLDDSVASVMTPNPARLHSSADAFEAALLMAEHHFAHVCVVDDDDRLIGVVSERDLFSLQRVDLVHLARTIGTAAHLRTLISLRADVGRLVETMLAHGAASDQILRIITTLNDCTVRRVLELNLKTHDPGISFTWLTFGSEGRQEQTLLTDQDNGILFETPDGMTADQAREKLLPFAGKVNDELAQCGFTLCKGNIMASNPKLCLSMEEWLDWFRRFIESATPENLLNSSIFMDIRSVFGPDDAVATLQQQVLGWTRKNTLFQKMMAANALTHRPPLNIFRGFIYAKGGEKHMLDLKKQGLTPFVDSARIYALAHGVAASNALERIERLTEAGVFDRKDASAWKEAYNLIQMIRMRSHQEQLAAGQAPTNRIDPDDLNQLDRRILRESFRQAQRLQQKLEVSYQL